MRGEGIKGGRRSSPHPLAEFRRTTSPTCDFEGRGETLISLSIPFLADSGGTEGAVGGKGGDYEEIEFPWPPGARGTVAP